MTTDFWKEFKTQVFSLAPMEDVTDTVFREVVLRHASFGNLHVVFTEFCNVDGLNHPVGRERVSERLVVSPAEKRLLKEKGVKLVAQIWGKNPEIFYKVSQWITQNHEFDGIDINMGCPVKKIIKHGACSALIGQPALAKEIIHAVKEGSHLPVSVKTRTGISRHNTEEWISSLLEAGPSAIILHGRTQRMQSDGEASWDEIARAVNVRNQAGTGTTIHGNGDVQSLDQARKRISESGVDGVMIGRGIFYDPWIFEDKTNCHTAEERIRTLLLHTRLFEKVWDSNKNFNILKRFYKIYINNFPGAAEMRASLMELKGYDDVYRFFEGSLAKTNGVID